MPSVKVISSTGNEYELERNLVAHIDPNHCVNCGECRNACPVQAIHENQRTICRLCPVCTEKESLTVDEMESLATEKACTTGCPLGISPQGYINLTRVGKTEKAYQLIWSKNPLPSICARICTHPCEQNCKRGILVDEPIAIRSIKRYLSENVEWRPEKYPRIYEETIAIVGAGPAGLCAAHYLSSAGYEVTVFESASEAGGMLVRGIPEFRLDRDIVRKEIANLEEAGIDIRLNEKINKRKLEELKKEFDAVVVATGAPNSKELHIEGHTLDGIMTAMNFMEHVNSGQEIYRHPGQVFDFNQGNVVIIGGGAVAIDCARAAVRLGAQKVTAVCVESGEDIPCHPWELLEAEEEGVTLLEGWAPQVFLGDHPKLEGVKFAKVIGFQKDSDGRISFDVDNNDTQMIPADWVIMAIGQTPDAAWKEVDGVYFAGEVNTVKSSVVDAMASGMKVASDVDADLRGRKLPDPDELRILHDAPLIEKIYPATRRKTIRPARPMLDMNQRISTFNEVEGCFTEEEALAEVNRCLQCGYEYVDPDKCIGCGVCQKVCPKGDVIALVRADEGGE